jgi:hypothetical protein
MGFDAVFFLHCETILTWPALSPFAMRLCRKRQVQTFVISNPAVVVLFGRQTCKQRERRCPQALIPKPAS